MKKLFFVYVCDDEVGEVEGVFEASGFLLGFWGNNDGHWRNEYFSPFMEKLGFECIESDRPDLVEKLRSVAKERWG